MTGHAALAHEIVGWSYHRKLDPRPPTSHVSRMDQEGLGRIFRRNIGSGTLVDHGTIFVGFAAQQVMLAAMLDSMAAYAGGPRDELTRYTTAISGAYSVVPSLGALGAFDGPG